MLYILLSLSPIPLRVITHLSKSVYAGISSLPVVISPSLIKSLTYKIFPLDSSNVPSSLPFVNNYPLPGRNAKAISLLLGSFCSPIISVKSFIVQGLIGLRAATTSLC